ncbi:hypothetical protein DFH06DRAFT_1216543 [Mycena polygramma]|nr:hypothetical protein DFH06DRAFT_1216543 [Mycena polygramma]
MLLRTASADDPENAALYIMAVSLSLRPHFPTRSPPNAVVPWQLTANDDPPPSYTPLFRPIRASHNVSISPAVSRWQPRHRPPISIPGAIQLQLSSHTDACYDTLLAARYAQEPPAAIVRGHSAAGAIGSAIIRPIPIRVTKLSSKREQLPCARVDGVSVRLDLAGRVVSPIAVFARQQVDIDPLASIRVFAPQQPVVAPQQP